jgi:cytochrome P450
VSNAPREDYDHFDEAFALDPHATWARMRQECPVARTERYGGFYVLTRLDDIVQVAQHPEVFSSFPADTPPDPRHKTRLVPMEVDPPDHRRYRRILEPLFRPKLIEVLEPQLRADARALVEDLLEAKERELDFIQVFALPFPTTAFLRLLGIPEATDTERYPLSTWVNEILHAQGAPAGDIEAKNAVRGHGGRCLRAFLNDAIASAPAHGTPGLLNTLLDPDIEGDKRLTPEELHNFLHVLVLGGLETVTTALGFAFLHLGRRPDLQEQLAERPDLIPSAVEETLRYESSVHPTRTVLSPCTIGGVDLVPGDRVALPYGSANRDESAFERADELLLDREGNRHVAFGAGVHRCLGSHLARLELRIAFEEVLDRIPAFTVPEATPIQAYGGQTRSIMNLPFRIVPG